MMVNLGVLPRREDGQVFGRMCSDAIEKIFVCENITDICKWNLVTSIQIVNFVENDYLKLAVHMKRFFCCLLVRNF
jgi:hypothetical protein